MLLQDPMKEVPPSIVPFTDRFRLAVRARLIQFGITPYRFCTDTLLCTEWYLNRILDGTYIPWDELGLGLKLEFIEKIHDQLNEKVGTELLAFKDRIESLLEQRGY